MTKERAEICAHVEVTLREYMDAKFEALEKANELAREVMEQRLHSLNEWKAQTLEDRGHFVRQELYEKLSNDVADMKGLFTKFAVIVGISVTVLQILEPAAFFFIFHK